MTNLELNVTFMNRYRHRQSTHDLTLSSLLRKPLIWFKFHKVLSLFIVPYILVFLSAPNLEGLTVMLDIGQDMRIIMITLHRSCMAVL